MRAIEKWAPWVAGAVLVAGIVAFAVTRLDNGASTPPHRKAPLSAAERRVALEFVTAAVGRSDLPRAWDLAAPELKQGMSRDEWNAGTIPVVPYPVAQARTLLRPISSFTDTGELRVTFVPRAGAATRPAAFTLDLRKLDGRWLVSAWVPASSIGPASGK
ncbi:MAG TPA: hypothetical protein VGN27_07400 [Gaiellaceae bacterium]|jgi:hypothetical protein|nr:hypothetical protein [Gaiellaceae bacterium]